MPDLPKIPVDWRWVIATLVSTGVITVLLLLVYFPLLPDPMPVHWNARGEADNWEPKSLQTFLFTVLLGPLITILTFIGSLLMISMQSAYVTGPGGAKTPDEAQRTWHGYRVSMKHMGWYFFTVNLFIMLLLLGSYRPEPLRTAGALSLLGILVSTAALIWAVHRDLRAIEAKYPKPPGERGKTWGILHNDPDDPRILVDTGSGMNYTFNIGRPAGRILALLLIGAPLLLLLGLVLAGLT